MEQWGKIIITVGALLVVYGIFLWKGYNPLSWLGNLPGDIKIQNENTTLYIPITTMIILSIVFTLLLYLFRK